MRDVLQETWIKYLSPIQQELVELSIALYEREIELASDFPDYSFVLFPLSKTYEGFLKKYLYEINVIDKKVYEGRRFRIGRALNPDISEKHRDEYWLYDDVAERCGEDMAREIWDAWLECRNRVFHFFPKDGVTMSLAEVENRMQQLFAAMRAAVACRRRNQPSAFV